MPTYEYVCSSCGHEWEIEQRITASALTTCPKCAGETAKRQVSGGSFILKGGGWYADLYSSTKPAKSDSGAAPSGSATGAGAASKSTAPAKTESGSSGAGSGSSSGSGSGSGSGSSSGGSGSGSGGSGSSSGGSTPSST